MSGSTGNLPLVELWERLLILGGVVLLAVAAARLLDRRLRTSDLAPGAETRYRVLRRTLTVSIVALGLFSALLVIPQVRAVAGGLLASSAVVGLIIGFAARTTLANFAAGISIAITQPLRLGDLVTVAGVEGQVEEVRLTYTFIRTVTGDRLVIPNEKLASEVIRNATIRGREKLAEATVDVPVSADVATLVEALRHDCAASGRDAEVLLTSVTDRATITVRAWAPDEAAAVRLASELRLRAHSSLRAHGAYPVAAPPQGPA
jgi:small-conductance mechanosensitive channel